MVAVAAPPPALDVLTRPMLPDERRYVLGSWSEAYKQAPKMGALTWALYKRHVLPELDAVLDRPDTSVLVAIEPGGSDVIGWLAFCRGRRVSTVHWVHARYRVGESGPQLRRRGVMTALLRDADLGARLVYTHRGPRPRHREPGARIETIDEVLARALAKRGITAAYVPFEEWAR